MRSLFTGPQPLPVAATATSSALPFPELASSASPPTIFLRLVQHGPAGPAPTFGLAAGPGTPVTLTGSFQSITAADGTLLADAATASDPDGTYRIRILAQQLGTSWSLSIHNNDTAARTYLGVVADNLDDTALPWIDVAPELDFRTVLGRPQALPVAVANLGTGDLQVTLPTGPQATYALSGIPESIGPNAVANLTMTFTPAATGATATDFTIASNDAAGGGPGHNQTVHITTVTTLFAPGTILVRQDGTGGPAVIAVDPGATAGRVVLTGQPLVGRSQLMVQGDGRLLLVPGDGSAPLVRIDPGTGAEEQLRFQPAVSQIRSAAVAPDGTVVAVIGANCVLVRLDPAAGTSRELTTGGSGSPLHTAQVTVGRDGTVYLLDNDVTGLTLYRVDPASGQRQAIAQSGLPAVMSIAADAAGNVLATSEESGAGGGFEWEAGQVHRIDSRTGAVSQVASVSELYPTGIAVGPDGHILVAAPSGVLSIDPATGQHSSLPAAPGVAGTPHDVAVVWPAGGAVT